MASYSAIAGTQGSGPMAKAMSVAGMVAGSLVAAMFAMDLVLKFPFGGPQVGGAMSDIGFIVCGGIVAYLGWNAFRDAK